MRRRTLLAAVLALLMTLTACAGLPSESAVKPGLALGPGPGEPFRIDYDGPRAGASQNDIVRGFLRAGAGFENDHEVARQFLTARLAEKWVPERKVVVHTGETNFTVKHQPPDHVTVGVKAVATVNSQGYYTDLSASAHRSARFTLQKVEGQWRISALPKGFGLWVSALDFERLYQAFGINYIDPKTRAMVPDVRWFPTGPGLATSLARAQLEPVPAYLRGAVETGVPTGASMAVDAVAIEDGTATLDLNARARDADVEHRKMMWAQFLTTLDQSPSVRGLTIRVDDAPLEVQGLSHSPTDPSDVGYGLTAPVDQPALLRSGTELTRVDATRIDLPPVRPKSAPELPQVPIGWIGLAASPSGDQLAAIGGDHKDLGRWEGETFHMVPRFATDLTEPSFGSQNGLWVAGQAGGRSRLWVINTITAMADAVPQEVAVPWLGDRQIIDFRMSRTDQRAVIVLHDPKTDLDQVAITAVKRDRHGKPVELTPPKRIGATLISVTDVVWVSDRSVAVLGRTSTRERIRPFVIDIGGQLTPLNPVEGARSITATGQGGSQGLLVVTDRDKILTRAGASWPEYGPGTDIVVPGS